MKFHNGELVTAEDVWFSFERYHGFHALMKARIATAEVVDPLDITWTKRPGPTSLTFYTGATGAGWIVPRKYVEKLGDDGSRKAPVWGWPRPVRLPSTQAWSWCWRAEQTGVSPPPLSAWY